MRLRVLAWLGLGPGLVEAVSLWQDSDDPAWGLVVAAVGLGLWAAFAQFLGLPYLVGGLSTWVRARPAVHGPDNPGPPGGEPGARPGDPARPAGRGGRRGSVDRARRAGVHDQGRALRGRREGGQRTQGRALERYRNARRTFLEGRQRWRGHAGPRRQRRLGLVALQPQRPDAIPQRDDVFGGVVIENIVLIVGRFGGLRRGRRTARV